MEELVLTEEEERKVEEGEAAGLLLDNPAYLTAIERIRADCAEKILTSAPAASAVREELYTLSRGLSAVTEELLLMKAQAGAIIANAARPETDEAPSLELPELEQDY